MARFVETHSYLDFINHEWDPQARPGIWDAERCEYTQLVNSVIKSHKSPSLKQFSICSYVDNSAKCIVAKWLEFVFSRGVEILVLDFTCTRHRVVLEESLRESGLCSSPQTLILFKSLKRLSILFVNVSGEAVKIFLRNCPLLEEFSIGYSLVTYDVEVCGTTLVLKHLEVECCSGEKSFRVSAPNLTRLMFRDALGKLFLESVPKLVEADFEFESQYEDVLQNVVPALFRLSSQLEVLNLSLDWPTEFLANEFPEMPKLRKLMVTFHAPKRQSLLPVTALLWASPHLQEFKLKCWDTTPYGDAPLQVVRNVERCRHLHLKLFELEGLVDGSDGHIELVTYISDNCIELEKIKIFLGSSFTSTDQKQAARNYGQLRLEGNLPQHIQLQLF